MGLVAGTKLLSSDIRAICRVGEPGCTYGFAGGSHVPPATLKFGRVLSSRGSNCIRKGGREAASACVHGAWANAG